MEEVRGNSMVIEPDEPPKHLGDEARNASGAGRRQVF